MRAPRTTRPLLAVISCAVLAIATLSARRARSDEPTGGEPIHLEYAAEPGCPSRGEVVERIEGYTSRWTTARPDQDARRFVLRITRRGASYVGRFEVQAPGQTETVARTMEGDRCDDVALGLAVAVALAIDPLAGGAQRPGPETVPPAPAPSAIPATAPPPALPRAAPSAVTVAPPPPPPRASASFSFGLRAEGTSAVSGLLAVLALWGEGRLTAPDARLPWLQPALRLGVRQSVPRTTVVGSSSTLILWSAGFLEACPVRLSPTSTVSVDTCLASNVGALSARVDDIPGAGLKRRFWIDYGASVGVRWQLHRHAFLETSAGASFPIVRDRLRVEPDGVVTEAPGVGFSLGLGVGWHL